MFDFLRPVALIVCDGSTAFIIDRASGSFLETVRASRREEAVRQAEAWCKRNGYRIESVNNETGIGRVPA